VGFLYTIEWHETLSCETYSKFFCCLFNSFELPYSCIGTSGVVLRLLCTTHIHTHTHHHTTPHTYIHTVNVHFGPSEEDGSIVWE